METAIQLEQFQGPLDLLLKLIEDQELPISEVALSQVTEQFLQYLDTLSEYNPEELADFLVVASRLVYLKSKVLLPYLYPPDPDDGPSLANQLKLYKAFVDLSKHIAFLWDRKLVAYGRSEKVHVVVDIFSPPENASFSQLEKMFLQVLKHLKPVAPLPRMSIDRSLSVKEKIVALYESIKQFKTLRFYDVIGVGANKTETIISFLAILQLVKDQKVSVEQENSFEHLVISLV
jgi:segregation and condensation protein A